MINNMLLGIGYHYIGNEDDYPYPGIHPTPEDTFQHQLEEIGKHFSFVGQNDILNALNGTTSLPERSCVITFDDGLREQYERALPILDSMGIPAIFFANGLPYDQKQMLLVHKIHWSRAHMPPDTFWQKVQEYYRTIEGHELQLDTLPITDKELYEHYCYDTPTVARLKYALNKGVISTETRARIIDAIFSECVADEQEIVNRFYMDTEQIQALYEKNYLGIHTYSHSSLSSLSREEISRELTQCISALGEVIGTTSPNIVSVSYPYAEIIPSYVFTIAAESGLQFGFTMERSFNKGLQNPLSLARFDTNDVIGGKQPYFHMSSDHTVVCDRPNMSLFRREYVKE